MASEPPLVPLAEWVDIDGLSARTNRLMRESWALVNEAVALFEAGDYSPLAWGQLQDVLAESTDVMEKFKPSWTTDFDRRWGADAT